MPKYFRRATRFSKYRRFRSTKYYRRTSNRVRHNRIIRKSLRRRPIRPEVKYLDITSGSATTPTQINGPTTINLSPTSITKGLGEGQMLGNQCIYRMVKSNFHFNGPEQTLADSTSDSTGYVRVVIWTPRVAYDRCLEYMNTYASFLTIFDFNMFTIHRDVNVKLGANTSPIYNSTGTLTGFQGNDFDMNKAKRFSVAFPRKVDFPVGVGSVTSITTPDFNKDVLWCTLIPFFASTLTKATFFLVSRTTYVDC